MIIFTATNGRHVLASLWCAAVRATLRTPAVLVEAHASEATGCADRAVKIPDRGMGNPLYVVRQVMPKDGQRMFLEEDIIPVVAWSPDDYPGSLLFLDAAGGAPWPSFTIARTRNVVGPFDLVPQRFVRDGGCPDWLPPELCQPALDANAKVVGRHFIHIDKIYRDTPFVAEKAMLVETIRDWLKGRTFAASAPGLGDRVASALESVGITKARVQAAASAVGIKDCGCAKRQAAMNAWASKHLGLPPGQSPPAS